MGMGTPGGIKSGNQELMKLNQEVRFTQSGGKILPRLWTLDSSHSIWHPRFMNSMSAISIIFGILLNVVGLVGFFGTGAAHPTSLSPCGLGLLLVICGLLARIEKIRMHVMHVCKCNVHTFRISSSP
jgi:hypothetical protein